MLPGWNYSASLIDDEGGWVVVLRADLAKPTEDPLRPNRLADSMKWTTDPRPDPEQAFFEALEIARATDPDHRMQMRNAIKSARDRWRKPPQVIAA